MADEKDFAKELNALIKRYVDGGCDPQDIADELLREGNYVFGTTTSKSIWKPSLLPAVKHLRASGTWRSGPFRAWRLLMQINVVANAVP